MKKVKFLISIAVLTVFMAVPLPAGADDVVGGNRLIYGHDGSEIRKIKTDPEGNPQVDIVAPLPVGTNAIGKLATNSGVDIGDATINNAAGAAAVNIQDGGNTITVDGTIVATPSGVQEIEGDEAEGSGALPQPILIGGDDGTDIKNMNVDATTGDVQVDITHTVDVDGSGVTQPVSGTFWQATQPVSGTVTANLSATDNAVLDAIDTVLDTINTKLVTGTVIGDVNLGATDNAVLDTIASDTTSIDGKITACNTGAVVISSALPAGTNTIGKVESVHSSDSVSVATGSIVFDAADDLTTEQKTSAISLGDVIAHPDGLYLLAIEKPIENTAGNLTVYTYNVIKIDETNARDVSHSTHTVEKITDTATYQNYLIQGLFVGEEQIKIGMKFVTDSGAITVKYRIYRL